MLRAVLSTTRLPILHRPLANPLFRLQLMSSSSNTTSDKTSTRRIRVYTKTGDKGSSALFNGERRPKNDEVFNALGDTDELNAHLGVAGELCSASNSVLRGRIQEIQSRLFDVGSAVATPLQAASEAKLQRVEFSSEHTTDLESWIDEMDATLPPLRNFILPSGGHAAAQLQVCRAVCRRAERRVVSLVVQQQVPEVVGIYLNRLSDFLFVASRFVSASEGKPEIIYKKSRTPATVTSATQE